MSGPIPKPLATRQRRNRTTTAAELPAVPKRRKTPKLPQDREWHEMTALWWRDVWRSPMADEYLDADVHGLFRLAVLVDTFWKEPSTALAAEIRLQGQCFGLTPIDRRRLQWTVASAETATEKRQKQKQDTGGQSAPAAPVADPRAALHLLG